MYTMKLLLATRNPAKTRDMRRTLGEFLSIGDTAFAHPDDIDADLNIVEDGSTFEENTMKKAREWMGRSGLITIADDGGLEIDALNGEPGGCCQEGGRNAPVEDCAGDYPVSIARQIAQDKI